MICSKYPGEWNDVSLKWARVLAYGEKTGLPNVLHIMDSERADQYRGVTYLAQVIEPLLQLRRYTESELMAALVQSFFTAWIETDENPMDNPFNEVGAGDTGGEADNISIDENEYEMAPGTVTHLRRGEKIVFGNPNIPTAGFETFIKTLCKLVGSALEIPYDVLIKEFNSSYSASRGALLEAWEAFRMRRAWLVDGFCAPVYRLWLAEAVARGRIKGKENMRTVSCVKYIGDFRVDIPVIGTGDGILVAVPQSVIELIPATYAGLVLSPNRSLIGEVCG